jgi:hypothetical protein
VGVIPTFEAYLASLTGLSVHADPTLATSHPDQVNTAAASLAAVPVINMAALAAWAREHPADGTRASRSAFLAAVFSCQNRSNSVRLVRQPSARGR